MRFRNDNSATFSTTIAGRVFTAPAGGCLEIPDELCHYVKSRGCALTPLDAVAFANVAEAGAAVSKPTVLESVPVHFDEDDQMVEGAEVPPPASSEATSMVAAALADLKGEQAPVKRRGKKG